MDSYHRCFSVFLCRDSCVELMLLSPGAVQFDRIYLGTPSKVAIVDHAKHKTIVLLKEGLPDAGMGTKLSQLPTPPLTSCNTLAASHCSQNQWCAL